MKNENEFIELLSKFEDVVFNGKVSQFNIDLIQDNRSDFDDLISDFYNQQNVDDFIGSFSYQIDNALEICKEGPDKEFLNELKSEVQKLKVGE